MKSKRRRAENTSFPDLGPQLENLRLQRGISQVQLAEAVGMGQSALSHLERRADILLSTLTEYVNSLGGSLSIEVKFRDGEKSNCWTVVVRLPLPICWSLPKAMGRWPFRLFLGLSSGVRRGMSCSAYVPFTPRRS